MTTTDWSHHVIAANDVSLHYVRHGPDGRPDAMPVLLLHGWPEFWYVWHKNIRALAADFDVIAPDLRGFGDSEKPDVPPGLDDYAADIVGLLDALGLEKAGIVGHDVGAYVGQTLALKYPERVAGLFFFNCPYPGIGRRWVESSQVNEIWYQSFHQLDFAPELLRSSREACRLYFRHFLSHWADRPDAFDEDLEAWVDNFLKPGNLEGGFAWYKSANVARLAQIRFGATKREKIAAKSYFLWGEKDPIIKVAWTDALGEYFSDFELETVPRAGHFVHYEQPELTNERIRAFFKTVSG